MNNPDTDWIKPGVQAAVTLATAENSGEVMIDGCERWIPQSALRPLPPPLSPTAQRVVEAAIAWCKWHRGYSTGTPTTPIADLYEATDAHLATLRPADPLAELVAAGEALADARVRYALAEDREPHAEDGPTRHLADEELRASKMVLDAAAARWTEARAAILLIERGGKGEG